MLETMLNGSLVEVSSLDTEWLLDFAADAEVRERQAGRAKLRAAAQWCVLHPATVESGFVTWSDTGLPGLCPDEEAALGGEGTPLVAAFTPEPFAAALGVSTVTGLQLLADALDLQHRLPRIWAAVEALAVAPWKARKIAQATHHLSKAAAASVDAQLADRIGSCGWRAIEFAVAQAIATYDPHLLETREKQGKDAWGVRLFHRGVGTDGGHDWAGTSHLEVTGDTLRASGIADPLEAHPGERSGGGRIATCRRTARPPATRPPTRTTRLPDRTALNPHDRPDPAHLLPRTVWNDTVVQRSTVAHPSHVGLTWFRRRAHRRSSAHRRGRGRRPVAIRPPPLRSPGTFPTGRLRPLRGRELVILRDRHCVFPWCTRDARACRPGPHHPLRGERPTRPDPARRPRRALPTAPPGQDVPPMALPPHPGRQLPMDRTPRTDLPGHPDRHHLHPAQLSLDKLDPQPPGSPGHHRVIRRAHRRRRVRGGAAYCVGEA